MRFSRPAPAALAALAALAACAPKTPAILFTNGKIFTAIPGRPFAEAMVVVGERITAVGTDQEARAAAPRGAVTVDLGGKVVVPGFNDAHDHIAPELPTVPVVTSTDPLPDPPFATVADSLRAVVARTPVGTRLEALVGERVLSDPEARRGTLDSIAPSHLVQIRAWTGHGAILNSAALAAAGIADSVPDPLGGRFDRDAKGRLTGLLEEYALFDNWGAFTVRSDSAVIAAFRARAAEGLRWGITSIQNMTTGVSAETVRRIVDTVALRVRLRLIRLPLTDHRGRLTESWTALRSSRAEVAVSGTKYILDGTPIERLAALREPYSDRPGYRGRLNFPPDTVRAILQEVVAANDQPILHAVGDSAVAVVLSSLAAVAPDSVWHRLRPRIEHGEGLAPDLIRLAKRLGVILVQNPTHLALTDAAPKRYGKARLPAFQPLKSALANGIPLAFGSDGPQNPFLNLMLAVIHPDNPPEAITLEQAVIAYTAGSAFAEGREHEKGTLAPGMLADFAVLSQDIFALPPDKIPATVSVLTLVGGRPVYDPERRLPTSLP
jgi:predicted amidohydrolase YtcJ